MLSCLHVLCLTPLSCCWLHQVMFRPRVFVVLEPRCVEHVLKTRFEAYAKVPLTPHHFI